MGTKKSQEREAAEWLRNQFDKLFDRYCTQLRCGTPTRIFTVDTPTNRIMLEEFKNNYLRQRAEFEGWEYRPVSVQITYVSEAHKLTHNLTVFYNPQPQGQNLGFEEIDSRIGVLRKLPQKDADRIRDNLQNIVDRDTRK